MPSPPPRRLSRSSIDLRDLELQHEKLSHTDSAPDIVGLDKYLKSSDSEPLHFQQQLRQQLLFQEQIQQQYYLGSRDSKAKQLRQNSLKKINNFLQPFFFPGSAHKRNDDEGREDEEEDQEQDLEDRDGLERIKSNGSLVGDVDAAGEMDTLNRFNEPAPGTTITTTTDDEETKRLSTAWAEDEESFGVLYSPAKSTNFYVNFYNEKIALGPHRDQYVKVPNYGGALSESDFLTIKDIANELDNSDNLQTEDEELRGCANNTLLPVGNVRNRRGRRRSSSCEEIPASSKGKISVGALVHQRLKAKRKEKAAAVVTDEDEEEHSSVIWKNFANKSRFGSTLKKFNSSSRLLVGSLFGSHCDRSSSGSKYKSFARNRNIMWSMDETTYRRKEDDEEEGDVDVEGNNKKKNSVGGVEGHAAANQLTIKRSNEQLMSTKADIIKNLICKSSKNNGHLGVDVSSSLSPPSSTSSSESGSAMVAVKHQSTGLSKRGEQPRRQHRVNRQRMRVFSDGNFDERVIDNENQLQKNKRPRVLSEGHESNSARAGSGQDQMRELQGKRSTTTTTTTTAGAAVAVSSSTNDTPDILVGLVNRTTIGDEDNQLEGETEHEQAQTTQAAKEQQPPPLESMIADLRHVVEKSHLMQGESMKNVDSSEKKKTVAMEKVLLMDMSEAEQQKYLQDTNRGGEPPQAAEKRDQPTSVTTKGGSNLITPNVNLSMVDQELLRAISNVTPVGGTTMTGKQDNDNMLDVLGTTTTKETIVPLGNGAPITTTSTSTTTTQTTATKPEIVMDSTVIMMKGSNNSGRVGNGKVDELSGSEKLSARNSLATPNNTKSPSALLKRDAHGMRLRQASVVTYDVNVINFGGTDDASDNYNYNGHGSFSSAAGQSNIVQHNGRHQSTSSASKLRVELHGILWNGWF